MEHLTKGFKDTGNAIKSFIDLLFNVLITLSEGIVGIWSSFTFEIGWVTIGVMVFVVVPVVVGSCTHLIPKVYRFVGMVHLLTMTLLVFMPLHKEFPVIDHAVGFVSTLIIFYSIGLFFVKILPNRNPGN